ncbi:MAG: fibrobacter succinogenes major paralogous domain-containing protein [candidate division KSB1 bacterium]|nr:fibrobacter succinogenes major paralogous domain-containing protein [candidate division KSB1 bacterium]
MLLVDKGIANQVNLTPDLANTGFLNKTSRDHYILRVSGNEIEPFEQRNLVITDNMTLNVTVIRTVSSVTDIDGNEYRTVKIGDLWWMAENLRVTHYRNGKDIPQVTGTAEWGQTTSGAFCNYENDALYTEPYGRLYNWYAVTHPDGLAPEGWRIPTDREWKDIEIYLGMNELQADMPGWRGTNEGGKLKATGTIEDGTGLWFPPNTGATNESGFSAIPAGYRDQNGYFFYLGFSTAFFWTKTEAETGSPLCRILEYNRADIMRTRYSKVHGLSVRCVSDSNTGKMK